MSHISYKEGELIINNVDAKPTTLTEWAYASIKRMIMEREYETGAQLQIENIMKSLGISRTPVREALLKLREEGLVTSIPRTGFFVNTMTQKSFDDLFELRRLIEGYAVEKAANQLTDEQIDRLREIQSACEGLNLPTQSQEFTELEIELHNLFIDSLNNSRISSIMCNGGLDDLLYRERRLASTSEANLKQSILEHSLIVAAIVERNPGKARKAMENHLKKVQQRIGKIITGSKKSSGSEMRQAKADET